MQASIVICDYFVTGRMHPDLILTTVTSTVDRSQNFTLKQLPHPKTLHKASKEIWLFTFQAQKNILLKLQSQKEVFGENCSLPRANVLHPEFIAALTAAMK
ncbi:hypothetical protein EMIT0P258_110074 [Pseudomonas sp. IT-P258]